ncbi:MAG: carboxypeptidase regulatory-like domain-containing protein [Flavobacteriales bacterium]|nr:carboxypeptidase regulatory-like domain-containing protein [Flavobacteriales bacterium]
MSALQSARPQREYPCGQQDLYTIIETGWGSYAEQLPRFSNLSTKYTAVVGAGQLLLLAAAQAMPDEDSREEVHKSYRVQLKHLADTCLITWSDMGTYIRDAFPEDEYENKRIAAGYNYYEGAAHENWDDVKGLMQSGLLFLNANATVLATDGGMPATFITAFETAKNAFGLKHQAFLQAEELTKVMTDEKIVANNALYRSLMKMFEDGKKIFREEAAIREQFTFDRVLALVNGGNAPSTGVAATVVELGVYVFDSETGIPKEGAEVRILNAPGGVVISATSNSEGIVFLRILGFEPHETVVLQGEISADGFVTESGEVEGIAGNFYSIEVGMQPMP